MPYRPRGAAAFGPKAAEANPAAIAKSRIEMVSSSAFAEDAPPVRPTRRPTTAEASKNTTTAKRTGRYLVEKCTSDATRATRAATVSVLVADATTSARAGG